MRQRTTISRASITAALSLLAIAACTPSATTAGSPQSTSSGDRAATYTVRLHRPMRVGQRLRVRAEATNDESRSTKVGAAEPERQASRRRTTIECVEEVLAVNRVGKPSRVALAITLLRAESDQGPLASLPAGTRVELALAPREADTTATIDGAPVSDAVRAALKDVRAFSADETTDDEVFGTSIPRAVGASWEARVGSLRSSLEETGMLVPEGGIRAMVTLSGLSQREPGAPLMTLSGDVTIARMTLSQLPEGFTSSAMNMRMRLEKTVSATNLEAPPLFESSAMESRAELRGTINGQPVTIEMNSDTSRRTTFSPAQ
ncbi:MAG: hypothetical protein JNK05_08150 [Myxococcales bacterium]|nr:hypothetical protein [Myxococcales bacterium]